MAAFYEAMYAYPCLSCLFRSTTRAHDHLAMEQRVVLAMPMSQFEANVS